MFHILLTIRAKKQLDVISRKHPILFEDILSTIEFLKSGRFNGGTRVKKMQGLSHENVMEARLNAGDRLIFLQEQRQLIVQYVYVAHDNVQRIIKNMALQQQADLWLQPVQENINEQALQQHLYQLYEESTHMPRHKLSTEEIKRIRAAGDMSLIDLQLTLSIDQQQLLQVPLPFLLHGQAGSGKSTVLLYRLYERALKAWEQQQPVTLLYVTANHYLVMQIQSLYQRLIKGHPGEAILLNSVDFLTIDQLMGVENTNNFYSKQSFLLDFSIYTMNQRKFKSTEGALLYSELIDVIGVNSLLQGEFSKQQYLNLPAYEAPNFVDRRSKVWQAYEWYTSLQKGPDEIDLLQKNLKLATTQYDLIVIDEIQDLNLGKVHFVLSLLNNPRAFIMAGDENQTVQLAHFNWNRLKDYFYHYWDMSQLPLFTLHENYRNPSNVQELSYRLQQYIKKYNIKSIKLPIQSLQQDSIVPLLTGTFPEILEGLQQVDVVIVADSKQEKKIRLEYEDLQLTPPFMLLPEEIKGLEFEKVALVNLTTAGNKKWQRIQRSQALTNTDEQFLTAEIQRLYVSLTRSLQQVAIYEETSEFWMQDTFKDVIQSFSIEHFQWNVSQHEIDWKQHAMHFFKIGNYKRFKQCLVRIDNLDETLSKCLAIVEAAEALTNHNFKQAATHFIQADDPIQALNCYEKCDDVEAYKHYALQAMKDLVNDTKYSQVVQHYQNTIWKTLSHRSEKMVRLLKNSEPDTKVISYYIKHKKHYALKVYVLKRAILKSLSNEAYDMLEQYFKQYKKYSFQEELDQI